MLDNMFWKVFEKTGSIDAYLLYANIKYMNGTKNDKLRNDTGINGTHSR